MQRRAIAVQIKSEKERPIGCSWKIWPCRTTPHPCAWSFSTWINPAFSCGTKVNREIEGTHFFKSNSIRCASVQPPPLKKNVQAASTSANRPPSVRSTTSGKTSSLSCNASASTSSRPSTWTSECFLYALLWDRVLLIDRSSGMVKLLIDWSTYVMADTGQPQ